MKYRKIPPRRVKLNGMEVVLHTADAPDQDVTTIDGVRVTTALRTCIDLATEIDIEDLRTMVATCLERELFTIDEAHARLDEEDMRTRPGGLLVRWALPGSCLVTRLRGRARYESGSA
jgi:hypothetical protein